MAQPQTVKDILIKYFAHTSSKYFLKIESKRKIP